MESRKVMEAGLAHEAAVALAQQLVERLVEHRVQDGVQRGVADRERRGDAAEHARDRDPPHAEPARVVKEDLQKPVRDKMRLRPKTW